MDMSTPVPTPTMEIFDVVTVTGVVKLALLEPLTSIVSPDAAAFTPSCSEQYGLAWVPAPVPVAQVAFASFAWV